MKKAIASIEDELDDRLAWFRGQNKLLEEQRLRMRTTFDLEMLKEIGSCSGVENYSPSTGGPGTPRTRSWTTSPTTSCSSSMSRT